MKGFIIALHIIKKSSINLPALFRLAEQQILSMQFVHETIIA